MRKANYSIKCIWSEANGCMMVYGFTYKKHHYTYNDADEVYWNDDVEEYFTVIPRGAVLDRA